MLFEQVKLLLIPFFDEKAISIIKEIESKEYWAAQVQLGSLYCYLRKAKINLSNTYTQQAWQQL